MDLVPFKPSGLPLVVKAWDLAGWSRPGTYGFRSHVRSLSGSMNYFGASPYGALPWLFIGASSGRWDLSTRVSRGASKLSWTPELSKKGKKDGLGEF